MCLVYIHRLSDHDGRLCSPGFAILSNQQLLDSFNSPLDGDKVFVTKDGRLLDGHPHLNELMTRINDGR
jgi:hypothetical protein